jgi:hypothetical protein
MTKPASKPYPVKAWGATDFAGNLMPIACFSQNDAEIESLKRWPMPARGQSRVIPVTITPEGE